MRIVKDPKERKQEILEGAIQVFAKKGYEKTSMSDIAKALGISQGLCYRYFPSKEAVYQEALEGYAEQIVQHFANRWKEPSGNFRKMVFSYSGNYEEYQMIEKEMEDLLTMFHGHECRRMHEQLILLIGKKLIPYMARLLEQAHAAGEIFVSDAYIMAHMLVFGQIGLLLDEHLTQEEKQKRIQETIWKLLEKR